jgi:hypothetical protein
VEELKKCPKCKIEKPAKVEEFGKDLKRKDCIGYYCLLCARKLARERYQRNIERRRMKSKEWAQNNPEKRSETGKKWRRENPKATWLGGAKQRAKDKGIPWDNDISDIVIPDFCPILGIPLFRGVGKHSPNSPSLDKFIPSLGYVKGNRWVISYRANIMKSDATLEEIVLLGKWAQDEIDRRG